MKNPDKIKKGIYFVTSNKQKFLIAAKAFKESGFNLRQKRLDTPEIQSNDLKDIASYSAEWAARRINHPIFSSDAGCFIEALNGFPGPFIKYINYYLSAQDYLKLMAGKKNRKVIFKDCLAYCEPGKKAITFFAEAHGTMAKKPGKPGSTSINEIFIPEGFDRPESEIPKEQMINFWNEKITNYKSLISFLKNTRH